MIFRHPLTGWEPVPHRASVAILRALGTLRRCRKCSAAQTTASDQLAEIVVTAEETLRKRGNGCDFSRCTGVHRAKKFGRIEGASSTFNSLYNNGSGRTVNWIARIAFLRKKTSWYWTASIRGIGQGRLRMNRDPSFGGSACTSMAPSIWQGPRSAPSQTCSDVERVEILKKGRRVLSSGRPKHHRRRDSA